MNKKWLAALLAVAVTGTCAAALTACNNEEDGGGHHFATGWTYNPDNLNLGHWHKCEDDGCNQVSGTAAHDWDEWATDPDNADKEKRECPTCHATETRDKQVEAHQHSWSEWTVATKPSDVAGKATRTCSGNGVCDAETTDKERELPALNKTDYVLTNDTATCAAAGTATYTYNKGGVNVSFTAASPVNSDNHSYDTTKWVSDGAQHWHAASCEHKVVDNAANRSDLASHTTGTDGYCTVCYTTSLTPVKNSFKFVAGNGIKFTAIIYGTSGDVNTFTYNGTATIQVEYGGYDDQGVFHSQTVTLSSGGTTSFDFTLANGQNVIYITSDSAEQVSGTFTRPAELGENESGYPVTPTKDGELYEFEGVDTPAGNKFQYVMTADNANAEIYIDGESGREKVTLPYKFRLADKAKKKFYMSYAGDNKITSYDVAITREWDEGSVMNPKKAELGVETSVDVAGEAVYCGFIPTEAGWYKVSSETPKAGLAAGAATTLGDTEKYGTGGNGFEYCIYVKDASIYGEATETSEARCFSFRIMSVSDAAITCNFKVEKMDDAGELVLDNASTGKQVYTFNASDNAPDYLLTVSELPAKGFWTVTYEVEGNKTVKEVTKTSVVISPTSGSEITVAYGNASGSVTIAEDDSSLRLPVGISGALTANKEYFFVAPNDGIFTLTTVLSNNYPYWTVNGTMQTTATVELELTEGERVSVKLIWNNKTVTSVPKDNAQLKLNGSVDVTVNKNSQKLVYLKGNAGVEYPLTIAGTGVQFVGGGTVKNVTAGADGNVLAYLEYTGAEESATVAVTVNSFKLTDSADTNQVTVLKASKKLLTYAGKANISYTFSLTGEGVQFVGGGTSKTVTADESGNVFVYVEYTGAEESGSCTVTIEQIPYALQLNTEYSRANGNQLYSQIEYSFTVTEAGNYVLSGISISSSTGYIIVNGEKHVFEGASTSNKITSYTFENVQAGATVIFSVSSILGSAKIKIEPVTTSEVTE